MKAFFVAAAMAACITPALADYYIIQEPTTKRCRIVEERPAPGIGVVIGDGGFGIRAEAESRCAPSRFVAKVPRRTCNSRRTAGADRSRPLSL